MRLVPFLTLAFLIVSQTGCIAFYSTHPVEVSVFDVETGEPVPDMPFRIEYHYMGVLNAPAGAESHTDSHGKRVVPIATFKNGPIYVRVGRSSFEVPLQIVRDGGTLRNRLAGDDERVRANNRWAIPNEVFVTLSP